MSYISHDVPLAALFLCLQAAWVSCISAYFIFMFSGQSDLAPSLRKTQVSILLPAINSISWQVQKPGPYRRASTHPRITLPNLCSTSDLSQHAGIPITPGTNSQIVIAAFLLAHHYQRHRAFFRPPLRPTHKPRQQ